MNLPFTELNEKLCRYKREVSHLKNLNIKSAHLLESSIDMTNSKSTETVALLSANVIHKMVDVVNIMLIVNLIYNCFLSPDHWEYIVSE